MQVSSMEPTKNDNKSNGNSSSEVETLLNTLRETGITAILTMNKKAQMAISNWAHGLVNRYNGILKNNPLKLKDIRKLPFSKVDAKMAIKLLLLASVKKGLDDDAVLDLRNKFVSLGSFQSIDQGNIIKLMNDIGDSHRKSMDVDMSSLPEANKYMNLIISEQKALLHEINSYLEDIRKIKKKV
jgi:hypothetical protein